MNDRDKRLAEFLAEIDAKLLFSVHKGETTIECHSCNGRTFIVMKFGQGEGWDIYRPSSESNSIESTLTATRRYLGLS